MVHARHILIKLTKNDPLEKAGISIEKKPIKFWRKALLPNANFENLVQNIAKAPALKSCGDLGFFPRGAHG